MESVKIMKEYQKFEEDYQNKKIFLITKLIFTLKYEYPILYGVKWDNSIFYLGCFTHFDIAQKFIINKNLSLDNGKKEMKKYYHCPLVIKKLESFQLSDEILLNLDRDYNFCLN